MSIHMADFRLITSTTVAAKVSKAVSRSERIIPSASIVIVGAAGLVVAFSFLPDDRRSWLTNIRRIDSIILAVQAITA